jgi:hypothetical protein
LFLIERRVLRQYSRAFSIEFARITFLIIVMKFLTNALLCNNNTHANDKNQTCARNHAKKN